MSNLFRRGDDITIIDNLTNIDEPSKKLLLGLYKDSTFFTIAKKTLEKLTDEEVPYLCETIRKANYDMNTQATLSMLVEANIPLTYSEEIGTHRFVDYTLMNRLYQVDRDKLTHLFKTAKTPNLYLEILGLKNKSLSDMHYLRGICVELGKSEEEAMLWAHNADHTLYALSYPLLITRNKEYENYVHLNLDEQVMAEVTKSLISRELIRDYNNLAKELLFYYTDGYRDVNYNIKLALERIGMNDNTANR